MKFKVQAFGIASAISMGVWTIVSTAVGITLLHMSGESAGLDMGAMINSLVISTPINMIYGYIAGAVIALVYNKMS